jgi:hypothetical protein
VFSVSDFFDSAVSEGEIREFIDSFVDVSDDSVKEVFFGSCVERGHSFSDVTRDDEVFEFFVEERAD